MAQELQSFDIRQVTQDRHRQRAQQQAGAASGRGLGGGSAPDRNSGGPGGYNPRESMGQGMGRSEGWEAAGDGQENQQALRLGVCCLVVCGLILALVIASMAVVPPTEFGLVLNWLTQTVGDARESGRYFIGPFAYMIPYPAVATNFEFSDRGTATRTYLSARTKDSLAIKVHTSFQLKLKVGAVRPFYLNFREDGWRGYVEREAVDLLLQATSDFTRTEIWERRSDISVAYQAKLQGFFNETLDITDCQLIKTELPADVEATIANTQWQIQQQSTRAAEQQAITIRASINVMLSDFERNKTIIENSATANANLLVKSAEAEAQFSRIAVENDAVNLIKAELDLTSQGIIAYQKGIAYQNLDGAKMLFGVQQTAALLSSVKTTATVAPSSSEMCVSVEDLKGGDPTAQMAAAAAQIQLR